MDFLVKGLLMQAITHASLLELGVGYCYERLEFLGDSVLDILITCHLYQKHTDIDPGELTDLRSASVNNENFALAAVRQNLHQYLQHSSGFLHSQITEFVKFVSGSSSLAKSFPSIKALKALGDIAESIAGAILIDTKVNLDEVWRIVEPLLSPIVTPDKLGLPPLRELIELCDSLGYFIKDDCTTRGETVHAELKLQLKDVLLVAEGLGPSRKAAKGQAAVHLLKDLESRGISKRGKQDPDLATGPSSLDSGNSSSATQLYQALTRGSSFARETEEVRDPNIEIPVIESISMKKGGPRTSLFDLCKSWQWPRPTFQSTERTSRQRMSLRGRWEPQGPFVGCFEKILRATGSVVQHAFYDLCKSKRSGARCYNGLCRSRTVARRNSCVSKLSACSYKLYITPIEIGEGPEKRKGFNAFVSQITLTIPDFGVLELTGDQCAHKKASFDSAALLMLHELQRRGKLAIGEV